MRRDEDGGAVRRATGRLSLPVVLAVVVLGVGFAERAALGRTLVAGAAPADDDTWLVPPWWDWWPITAVKEEDAVGPPDAPWVAPAVWPLRDELNPMQVAAIAGDVRAIEWLLEREVPADDGRHGIDGLTGFVHTPLGFAVGFGQVEAAATLIAHGADIEARDERGLTPLMIAAGTPAIEGGDPMRCVELLLDAGADVTVGSGFRGTALEHALGIALVRGPGPIVPPPALERSRGPSFEVTGSLVGLENRLPKVVRAASQGDAARARVFLELSPLPTGRQAGHRMLRSATLRTDSERWLMLYDALDVVSWLETTRTELLLVAITDGTGPMVERLLADHGDRPLPYEGGPDATLASMAIGSGEDIGEKVSHLVAAGAPLDHRNADSLSIAIRDGDGHDVEHLLRLGVEVRSDFRWPQLVLEAAQHGDAASLRTVLDAAPASLDLVHRPEPGTGRSILVYAAHSERDADAKVALLLERGASVHGTSEPPTPNLLQPVVAAARASNFDAMLRLIEHGADLHALDTGAFVGKWAMYTAGPRRATLLHLVARDVLGAPPSDDTSVTEALTFLIESGLDVDARAAGGWTPLLCAVDRDNAEAALLLLDAGASADVAIERSDTRRGGRSRTWTITPLRRAIEHGQDAVVQRLIEAGAEFDRRGPDGVTPLHHAVRAGKASIVRQLIDAGADPTRTTTDGWTTVELARRQWGEAFAEEIAELIASSGDEGAKSGP